MVSHYGGRLETKDKTIPLHGKMKQTGGETSLRREEIIEIGDDRILSRGEMIYTSNDTIP